MKGYADLRPLLTAVALAKRLRDDAMLTLDDDEANSTPLGVSALDLSARGR